MDIIDAYQQAISSHGFDPDPAQLKVIDRLRGIQLELEKASTKHGFTALLDLLGFRRKTIRGLYLWGDVGRGKTWLMNLFVDALEFEDKKRIHFHHFMIEIHDRLARLRQQKNPLEKIARDYAQRYRLLCLDEFIVTNITDAMLLYGLLEALLDNGVTLIMTSNRVPDDLYKNGLQRERFLPAIELIKHNTVTVNLDGNSDHRLALLEKSAIYIDTNDADSRQRLLAELKLLASGQILVDKQLNINNRMISTEYYCDEIAWFSFDALCDAPRATPDYIELARRFHTIILSDVPIMDEYLDDKARRFIYLIDELYDRRVKLIISAASDAENLYTGELLRFAFRRTASRLKEMRSESYLASSHRL